MTITVHIDEVPVPQRQLRYVVECDAPGCDVTTEVGGIPYEEHHRRIPRIPARPCDGCGWVASRHVAARTSSAHSSRCVSREMGTSCIGAVGHEEVGVERGTRGDRRAYYGAIPRGRGVGWFSDSPRHGNGANMASVSYRSRGNLAQVNEPSVSTFGASAKAVVEWRNYHAPLWRAASRPRRTDPKHGITTGQHRRFTRDG